MLCDWFSVEQIRSLLLPVLRLTDLLLWLRYGALRTGLRSASSSREAAINLLSRQKLTILLRLLSTDGYHRTADVSSKRFTWAVTSKFLQGRSTAPVKKNRSNLSTCLRFSSRLLATFVFYKQLSNAQMTCNVWCLTYGCKCSKALPSNRKRLRLVHHSQRRET